MTEPTAQPAPGGESPGHTLGSRVVAWLGAIVLVAVVLILFVHVVAPAIGSDEEPPPGHPQSACVACHMVTGDAGAEKP